MVDPANPNKAPDVGRRHFRRDVFLFSHGGTDARRNRLVVRERTSRNAGTAAETFDVSAQFPAVHAV